MLSLSKTMYASKNTTSSPSGSNAKISGVTVTDECWSKVISGRGTVISRGVPKRITVNSNQSEKE